MTTPSPRMTPHRVMPLPPPLQTCLPDHKSQALALDSQRLKCIAASHPFTVPELRHFVRDVLEDDQVVLALSAERGLRYIHPREGRRQVTVAGLTSSARAATVARQFKHLTMHERPVAALAGFLYGVGACHLYRTFAASLHLPPLPQALRLAHSHRLGFVEQPLRTLRAQHPGLGGLMAEALGQRGQEHMDPDQVSRVVAAVRLANLRTEQAWLGPAVIL